VIYCYGDSWSYPYVKNGELETYKWPDRLKVKLRQKAITNNSIPGCSNWRIARQIATTKFTPDDFVVVSWTHSSRLEFGANIRTGKERIFTGKEKLSKNRWLGDVVEVNNNVLSRRITNQLNTLKLINNKDLKTFVDLIYNDYYNEPWLEEMFVIMFNSVVYTLTQSKCKWVMFNAWATQYNSDTDIFNIPEYLLGYKNTMNDFLRPDTPGNLNYWNWSEHDKIAEIIYERF